MDHFSTVRRPPQKVSKANHRYCAFVRNVMIGREGLHREVLLDLFDSAGAGTPRSYISTGNVSFSSQVTALPDIAASVEEGIDATIGRSEPIFIRPMSHLADLVADDPFADAPYDDAVERTVSFLPADTDPSHLELPLEATSGRVSIFAATTTEILSVGRSVGGRTQGAGGFVERELGCRVTSRAWSTVLSIVDNPV